MQRLAQRLMLQGRSPQPNLPTAIFGTANTVGQAIYTNQPPVRIGLWPIVCSADPRLGMGVFAVLGYLLDRYQGVRVYRLCAIIGGEPNTYVWQISKSQFDVDDWQLEGLDDNVGLWGSLERSDEGVWSLVLNVEDDLAHSDDDAKVFSTSSSSLAALLRQLPDHVADIASYLNLDTKVIAPGYDLEIRDSTTLNNALVATFEWELKLYLYLWGRGWDEAQMLRDVNDLIAKAEDMDAFGAWIYANAVARLMIFTDVSVEDILLPAVRDITQRFAPDQSPPILLSTALYDSSLTEEAYDLLIKEIDEDRATSLTYLALAELYRRSGRAEGAVDVLQDAIENNSVSAHLYQRYAELLIAMEYNGYTYDTFVLIDPDDIRDDQLLWEAVEAYEAGLGLDPGNVALLSRQLLQLAELDDDRLWARFEQLVASDSTGQYVRTVVDALYNLEDLESGIAALKQMIGEQPDRVDGYVNLAVLYTLVEDSDAALDLLSKARNLTDNVDVRADIQRLTFIAEDPEFEMRLGEISDIVSAGNDLKSEHVEFLEEILERAPSFAEAYILLARAYIGWDEPGSALETLMDGYRHVPDDPDVIALLSQTLWESDEQEAALSYLDKGISQNPQHVPLLALAGQYLFEDGQEEAAKAYLARAEAISPRDPTLAKVRVQIARIIGQ